MNYKEFEFTLEQSLPTDASPELREKTETIKKTSKVFFDYQDFYCEKHGVSQEVFDKVSESKSKQWLMELMKDESIGNLSEDDFKKIMFDKMTEDVEKEGFEDIEGFKLSLDALSNFM